MSKFTEAFEKFLKEYFTEVGSMELKSDILAFYQAQNDDLYEKVESLLPEEKKYLLRELEEAYQLEMSERSKLSFMLGFNKFKEIHKQLNL